MGQILLKITSHVITIGSIHRRSEENNIDTLLGIPLSNEAYNCIFFSIFLHVVKLSSEILIALLKEISQILT